MKKIVNVRIYVYCACLLASGIAFGYALKFYAVSYLWTFLIIPIALLAFLPYALKRRRLMPILYLACTILLFLVGSLYTIAQMNTYDKTEVERYKTYSVLGTIIDVGYNDTGDYVLLDNVFANGEKLSGSLKLYLDENEEYTIGKIAHFTGQIYQYNLFNYGELNYNVYNNIKFYATYYNSFYQTEQFSLFHFVRARINDALFENLDNDTAALCYGMLIGNTDRMDDGSLTSFRYGGVAHIFSVSGLHVGIVFAVISFILKKTKIVPYYSRYVLSIIAVFLYSGICGFTLSSIRAAIMCTVSSIHFLIYRKYESLNGLAVAVIIILLINPLSLFSVGFQLSVCAVAGISVFSCIFSKLLFKIKLPKNEFWQTSISKVFTGLSMSLGAQIGTLPILLSSFGYLSISGLFLNFLIIPIISAFFAFMFIGVSFSAIFLGLAKYIVPVFIMPVQATASFLIGAGFENSIVSGFGAGIFVPIYFVCALAISDKINIQGIKRLVAIALSCTILFSTVMANTYLPVNGYRIITAGYSGGGAVLFKNSKGTVLVVSDNVNPSRIYDILNENYSINLSAIIFLGDVENILYFDDIGADCSEIYSYILNLPIQPYDDAFVHYEQKFSLCGIEFEFLDEYNLTANLDDITVGISSDEVKIAECDLLISVEENFFCDAEVIAYFGLSYSPLNTYKCGTITFLAKNSSLKLLTLLPNR